MQDIDFDEIDRAVNSVAKTPSDTPTVALDPTPVVDSVTVDQNPITTTSEPQVPTTERSAVSSLAARRSSGRFMDVVHPSSDMRPELLTRSQAPTTTSFQREEVAPPEREEPTESVTPVVAAVTAPSAAFHWPDPIDAAPAVVDVPPVVDVPAVAEATSLESPFLSDAKVEKRPLGAFSGAETEMELIEDPLPDFLTPGDQAEEPLLEAENPIEPVKETVAEVPVGPTSITQQYQEQTPTEPQTSGSIFDTEAYHQPLTHPVKKRSGALAAVWVVALVLVGGGLGAALYYIVLPMLG